MQNIIIPPLGRRGCILFYHRVSVCPSVWKISVGFILSNYSSQRLEILTHSLSRHDMWWDSYSYRTNQTPPIRKETGFNFEVHPRFTSLPRSKPKVNSEWTQRVYPNQKYTPKNIRYNTRYMFILSIQGMGITGGMVVR